MAPLISRTVATEEAGFAGGPAAPRAIGITTESASPMAPARITRARSDAGFISAHPPLGLAGDPRPRRSAGWTTTPDDRRTWRSGTLRLSRPRQARSRWQPRML